MSELRLNTDGHIIKFGADNDVSLTHVADAGLLLNSTMKLQFNDATQFVQGISGTVLGLGATDEIDLTATAVDLNGTLDVSGASQFNGAMVLAGTTPTLTIGDAGAEDTKIVFDGNAQDYYIGLDDSADDLIIGLGSAVGTTPIISMIDTGETKITSTNSAATTPTLNVHTTGNSNGAFANLKFTSAGNVLGSFIKGLQSSSGNDCDLIFGTNNSGSAVDAMRIRSDGTVGIGTGPDNTKLKVQTSTDGEKIMQLRHGDADNPNGFQIQYFGGAPNNTGDNFITCEDTGATRFKVESNGNVESATNSFGAVSDERIKQNISDASSQWDDIKAIKVRNYKLKSDTTKTHIGVVAQELETSGMNGLVKESDPSRGDILVDSSFGTLVNDTDNPNADGSFPKKVGEIKAQVKGVKYSVLYMKAIKALQEAMAKIESLEARVTTLEG